MLSNLFFLPYRSISLYATQSLCIATSQSLTARQQKWLGNATGEISERGNWQTPDSDQRMQRREKSFSTVSCMLQDNHFNRRVHDTGPFSKHFRSVPLGCSLETLACRKARGKCATAASLGTARGVLRRLAASYTLRLYMLKLLKIRPRDAEHCWWRVSNLERIPIWAVQPTAREPWFDALHPGRLALSIVALSSAQCWFGFSLATVYRAWARLKRRGSRLLESDGRGRPLQRFSGGIYRGNGGGDVVARLGPHGKMQSGSALVTCQWTRGGV
jgi:hypothetical protein